MGDTDSHMAKLNVICCKIQPHQRKTKPILTPLVYICLSFQPGFTCSNLLMQWLIQVAVTDEVKCFEILSKGLHVCSDLI